MKKNNDNNHKLYHKKEEDLLLFSTTLIYEQNIDKVWHFIRDLNNEIKVRPNFDSLIYIKGDNTWNKGNIFSINYFSLSFHYKCFKKIEDKTKKIIKWKIKSNIGTEIYKELNLYPITQGGKTLVKSITSQTEKEDDLNDYKSSKNYYLNFEKNLLKEKSILLQNLKEDIISYKSCIINANYLTIWKILLDSDQIVEIFSTCGRFMEFSNAKIDEGVFLKIYNNDLNYTFYYKIDEIKAYKKRKQWKIKIERIGIYNYFFAKEIEITITIINTYQTKLSILHKFKYDINKDIFNIIEFRKIEKMKIFKKYIEELNDK